jgi:hypothetical protein
MLLGDTSRGEALGAQHLAQRPSAHQLHRDVGLAFVLPEPIDVDHVGVVEAGEVPALGQEAPQLALVADRGVHHLDRDRAVQLQLVALVDHAEAATADHAVDPVAAVDDGADHGDSLRRRVTVLREKS